MHRVMEWIRDNPVIVRNTIMGLVAVVALVIGQQVDETVVDAVCGVVAAVSAAWLTWSARQKVTPTRKLGGN